MNMRRLFSYVLLACVCLSVLFTNSHTAYANENDALNSAFVQQSFGYGSTDIPIVSTDNFGEYAPTMGQTYNLPCSWFNDAVDVFNRIHVASDVKLFPKKAKLDFTITNLMNYVTLYNSIGEAEAVYNFNKNHVTNVVVTLIDGNNNYYDYAPSSYTVRSSGPNMDINVAFDELPVDVYGIRITVHYKFSAYGMPSSYYNASYSYAAFGGFNYSKMGATVTPFDEKVGLLDSIIQIVNNIKDGIVNLPSKIANSIKTFFDNVVNSITSMATSISNKLQSVLTGIQDKLQFVLDGIKNALTTLGNFLIDGIKGLFVPTEEDITGIKDDWENLLATRFGALYEVVQLCIDYANSFNSTASVSVVSGGSSTITFPVVSIPLGSVSFEFGGWEVDIVPKGFEFFIDSIKLMFSVCATILFVNGLRNKFDKVVSK